MRPGGILLAGALAGSILAGAATRSDDDFDLAERARHWSFQPVAAAPVPSVRDRTWPRIAADAFVLARLEGAGLGPAPEADRRTWLRRVSYALVGLPPTPEELAAFLADGAPQAHERVVDRLLASPHYGETWARHWLDLVRYADTKGHEFDHPIPNAWRYRDWIVRAFDADVPYDRFVLEQVAGDLLDEPRPHATEGWDESILGTGWWWLGSEMHSPVDIRADETDRIADQVDTFSRAFLGLTVACARCHDHKADAILQRDYYALSGFALSTHYRQVRFASRDANAAVAAELEELRAEHEPGLRALLEDSAPAAIELPADARVRVDYTAPGAGLIQDGVAFAPRPAGSVLLGADGPRPLKVACAVADPAWDGLALAPGTETEPGQVNWERAGRTLVTPTFTLDGGRLHLLARGAARVYAAVDSHKLVEGPLHGASVFELKAPPGGPAWGWTTHDLSRYAGHRLRLELTPERPTDFALAMVVEGPTVPAIALPAPASPAPSAEVERAAAAWRAARAEVLARGVLVSPTAPAALDGSGVDELFLLRGDPRTPADPVPRALLTALGGRVAAPEHASGRLDLARSLVDGSNPFVPRAWVNRVWHHLFGRGIVATVDDLGAMGEPPTHPELLDHLALRFSAEHGWSTKRLIRELVLSATFRQSSRAAPSADAVDPDNRLWHRMQVRPLTAEALRDTLLAVSGELDRTRFGPAVPLHLTPFLQGRGRPGESGPRDGDRRRSLYLSVRRNFPTPLLAVFDLPVPSCAMGRRSTSNVPAQASSLLNDPFVTDRARAWAERVLAMEPGDDAARVERLFLEALARPPEPDEAAEARAFLAATDGAWPDLAHVLFNLKELRFLR